MRNIPSYEAFVGESYEAIRKAMRKAGVSGTSKEDTHGTTVTFRSDEDRDAAAAAIKAAGLSAKPVDGHALRVTETVNESSAATIAIASDISDYQKNMSREAFDKLVDKVAANLNMHDKSKRQLLADHLSNSLPRPDDDERLSRKDIAGLAGEIVYGKWMGESRVDESTFMSRGEKLLRVLKASVEALKKGDQKYRMDEFMNDWRGLEVRIANTRILSGADVDEFLTEFLADYNLESVMDAFRGK